MGIVNLYHPVTEEKATEFVAATTDPELTDDDRKQRVGQLLEAAANNRSWREALDPAEQIRLANEPFASSPENTDPAFTGEGS